MTSAAFAANSGRIELRHDEQTKIRRASADVDYKESAALRLASYDDTGSSSDRFCHAFCHKKRGQCDSRKFVHRRTNLANFYATLPLTSEGVR